MPLNLIQNLKLFENVMRRMKLNSSETFYPSWSDVYNIWNACWFQKTLYRYMELNAWIMIIYVLFSLWSNVMFFVMSINYFYEGLEND